MRLSQSCARWQRGSTPETLPEGLVLENAFVVRALFAGIEALEAKKIQAVCQSSPPVNAGKPWHAEDDRQVQTMFAAGASLGKIAHALQRTRGAIAARIVRLGLAPEREALVFRGR